MLWIRKPMPSYSLIRMDKKNIIKRLIIKAAIVKKNEIIEFIKEFNCF